MIETSSLAEQIRHGKLRPMLDLGVTPSKVSLHGSALCLDEADGEAEPEEESKEPRSYCIPMQSLGLGGNKITSLGAGYLADGLQTNTSECMEGGREGGVGKGGRGEGGKKQTHQFSLI